MWLRVYLLSAAVMVTPSCWFLYLFHKLSKPMLPLQVSNWISKWNIISGWLKKWKWKGYKRPATTFSLLTTGGHPPLHFPKNCTGSAVYSFSVPLQCMLPCMCLNPGRCPPLPGFVPGLVFNLASSQLLLVSQPPHQLYSCHLPLLELCSGVHSE